MNKVTTKGSYYYVLLGENSKMHIVDKQKMCSCGQPDCPALGAVRDYLKSGGERTADGPFLPCRCPICGDEIVPDHNLNGAYTKEPGWQCKSGGKHHFYQAKTAKIKENFAKNPWLFKPIPEVYEGLRRDDVMSAEECVDALRKEFLATGYNPAA
jgi:hypothetical protein